MTYEFLGLLPAREPLTSRGRRLQDTPEQRQNVMYAPDILMQVVVVDAAAKLSVQFSDSSELLLWQGETVKMKVWVINSGTEPIQRIWMLASPTDEIFVPSRDVANPGMNHDHHSPNLLKRSQ